VAGKVSNDDRDTIISSFRERVCEQMGVAPFLHQREVWAASDGLELTYEEPTPGVDGLTIRTESGEIQRIGYTPRKAGRARFLSDLGAFKIGKSYGAALWASGFAAVPGAVVNLVGLEYDICEPEFTYLCEFLLSADGMNMSKGSTWTNRARDGKMFMDLVTGAKFVARSWERKDTLKGKEIDAYVYCEAYQLPGIECFTSFSQNLRARRGYAYFATTPDRPWIKLLHELGHGGDPEWHCTCSVPADANPYTFDQISKDRDKKLMTTEKYLIHYEGQMGDFIGRVFNYAKGQYVFTPASHPQLFDDHGQLRVPAHWEVVGGADTGTYHSALLVAFDPDGNAYVLSEHPNYRYVAGSLERDESLTIPAWGRAISRTALGYGGRTTFWADSNSQFKGELRNYGVVLLPAKVPVETRTEITREYFEHRRVFLAPWLDVLPFELENASWPEEATASGKFARIKDRDHTLDCLEHILARRPFGRTNPHTQRTGSWAASMGFRKKQLSHNVHMGRM